MWERHGKGIHAVLDEDETTMTLERVAVGGAAILAYVMALRTIVIKLIGAEKPRWSVAKQYDTFWEAEILINDHETEFNLSPVNLLPTWNGDLYHKLFWRDTKQCEGEEAEKQWMGLGWGAE